MKGLRLMCGRKQRRRGSSARAEHAEAEPAQLGDIQRPGCDFGEPPREQGDVEAQPSRALVALLFVLAQQIDQERREIMAIQRIGQEAGVRIKAAAAAALCEQDEPGRPRRDRKLALDQTGCELDSDRARRSCWSVRLMASSRCAALLATGAHR